MIDFIKDKDDSEAKRSNSIKSTDTRASMPENKDRMTQQRQPDYHSVPGLNCA